jgi:hypothetical protein
LEVSRLHPHLIAITLRKIPPSLCIKAIVGNVLCQKAGQLAEPGFPAGISLDEVKTNDCRRRFITRNPILDVREVRIVVGALNFE